MWDRCVYAYTYPPRTSMAPYHLDDSSPAIAPRAPARPRHPFHSAEPALAFDISTIRPLIDARSVAGREAQLGAEVEAMRASEAAELRGQREALVTVYCLIERPPVTTPLTTHAPAR